jgi:hypothetical protein
MVQIYTYLLCANLRRYCGKPMASTQLHTSRTSQVATCRFMASITAASRRPCTTQGHNTKRKRCLTALCRSQPHTQAHSLWWTPDDVMPC